MKKAIATSQLMMLIVSAVVVVLLVAFGFKGFALLNQKASTQDMQHLMISFQEDAARVLPRYGSVYEGSYALPSGVYEICIVDTSMRSDLEKSPLFSSHPILANSVRDGVEDSVFFFDKDGDIIYRDKLSVGIPFYPHLLCFHKPFSMLWEGRGKSVIIDNEGVYRTDLSDGDIVLSSTDGRVRLFASKDTPHQGDGLSFRIVPPLTNSLTDSLEFLSTATFCSESSLDLVDGHRIPFKDGKKVDDQGLRLEFFLSGWQECSDQILIFLYEGEEEPVVYEGTCENDRLVFWICDI